MEESIAELLKLYEMSYMLLNGELYGRDSMCSAFRMGPAASEREPCDFDRVLFRVALITYQKIGKSLHDENTLISCLSRF